MDITIEQQVELPHFCIEVATVNLVRTIEAPAFGHYKVAQRLSDHHGPLRLDKLSQHETFSRVGAVTLLPPDQPVRVYPLEAPLRVLHCAIDEAYFEQVTQQGPDHWKSHAGSLLNIRNEPVERLMNHLHVELRQPGLGHEMKLETIGKMMLIELGRYGQQLKIASEKNPSSLALAPWQLGRIYQRIAEGPQLGYPKLAELAALCGVSEAHLSRSFKQATGRHVHKFITEHRTRAAMHLLSGPDKMTCEAVASALGYKSAAYFSTAFRRMTGKTPSEFRQQRLQQAEPASGT
ncbi:MAG: hypothetical protein CML06_19110 [Pseudomonadales bacterium]|nr:hypothetical protein [Pseudomonadales bacterium]